MTASPAIPPALPAPYDHDAEHLKILSICWYVLAALHALAACFVLLYVGIGVVVALVGVAGGAAAGEAAHNPAAVVLGLPFAAFGTFVILLGGFLLLLLLTLAFLHYKCGKSLARRQNSTLCYVMAAIVCLNIPWGTALGVCTFIVLARPTVKNQFH